MAKVRNINNNLDQNLNGNYFNNTASETIFSFGRFSVTTNFDGRQYIDYKNELSTFVRPVTLETLGIDDVQSAIIHDYNTNAILNLDKSNLNTYIKFGSTYEYLRVSVQEIILKYPGSLYVDSATLIGGNPTFYDININKLDGTTKFKVPSQYIKNTFGLVFNQGNVSKPDDMEIRNLNLSYDKYVVWSKFVPGQAFPVIGFTGDTNGIPYIIVETIGNPFPSHTGGTSALGYGSFHIRPNNFQFEEFRALLTDYEKYMVSNRVGISGFQFIVNEPILLDDGNVTYSNATLLWVTSDGYNIDINTGGYQTFLNSLLTIGAKYDSVKTDLIARFLTPVSLKTYDLTEDGKMTKLLRVYGWEFDQLRKFIDSLVYINTVTYNKLNNIPDQLVSNLARTFGWNYFNLVNEGELIDSFLTIDEKERNLHTDLLPAEVNIELWRRILMNANYFWKSKGTREAIRSMFLLIGIPEPFISITEYVYTVNGKIDPREVTLTKADFPSNSLPYDNSGYPVAPLETNSFYFQVSGDTDSGQAYMNVFRMAGFDLMQTVDNKKSWIQTGSTTRVHSSTNQYYQEDSKLVLNTKEVDISLDTARGIEYDVFEYMKIDYSANSSGYTLPFAYVNISLAYTGSENTFTLPSQYNKAEGDLEVRFNGILLNAPKESNYSGGTGGIYAETTKADYIINGNTFTLTGGTAINANGHRDVVEATYLYSGSTVIPISGVTVKYMVTRIKPDVIRTSIPLPTIPNGDVQVTMNGIALTKGTGQFIADYIIDPNNPGQIIIQNPEVIGYMAVNPYVQVAYITVTGSTSVAARSEIQRVDSFNSSKIYFNESANKYVYRLNYKINNARDVKVLVDGIALEPYTDYNVNVNNKFEIYLPKGLKYGSIISAYYIVAGDDYFDPIIANTYGVGNIGTMSFLEFIEFIQRRLINATNRKVITDFKGGWYPTLLNVYIQYLNRSRLPLNNPLHSNGYTFANLYPFLSKYNAFFQRFVDELLSATIIQRKGGLLVRNSVFTKQKFTYKRGVYMGFVDNYSTENATTFTYDKQLNYLGDDGSTFLKRQLTQDTDWSDDIVCVSDLCLTLKVANVEISYPTTTTTTTQYPYLSVMVINETLTDQGSGGDDTIETAYRTTTYTIQLSPAIMPGYSVLAKLDFESNLNATYSADYATSVITVKKNNVLAFTITNTINGGFDTIPNSTNISIGNGDVIDVILENIVEVPALSGDYVNTSTTMTPSVRSVQPNGTISMIMPINVTNVLSVG